MTIPDDKEINDLEKRIESYIREKIKDFNARVKVSVGRLSLYEVQFKIDDDLKTINILIYSANYPENYYHYEMVFLNELIFRYKIMREQIETEKKMENLELQLGKLKINSDNAKQIIANGEGPSVEFKSSFRWDIRRKIVNTELEYVIAKETSGFLNSNGGLVIIGVDDNGNILGLDNDYKTLGKKGNKDGFQLKLVQVINNYIGNEFGDFWHVKFLNIDQKDICVIEVDKCIEPAFTKKFKNLKEEDFYIRKGSRTDPLSMSASVKYIEYHFKKEDFIEETKN